MSNLMTFDDLRGILIACAGDDETEPLHRGAQDISFEDLGFDSLALIETAATIKLEHGVDLTEQISEIGTPAELLKMVNDRIAA